MKRLIEYRDATDDSDQRVAYPEVVAGFVDLGFQRVGRLLGEPVDGLEAVAAQYDSAARDRFLEMAPIPAPILASPDGTAFAEVSWFWESPSIRIRSLLEDGSLVETVRLWDHTLDLPQARASGQNFDRYREMTRSSSPDRGRSIEAVADAGPAEMWQAHQRHLSWVAGRRNARPIRHASTDQAIAVTRAAFEHDYRVVARTRNLMLASFAAYSLAVIPVIFTARFYGLLPLVAVGAIALLGYLPLARWAATRLRYLPESLRPAFTR